MHTLSALEIARQIQAGSTSATTVLAALKQQHLDLHQSLNAVVITDWERAEARAQAADVAHARGECWGPLHGVPMTVKESFDVEGLPTCFGDPRLGHYIAKTHAVAVQRLIDAGAIIFGKTNVPFHMMDLQTFNRVYGTSNNPWNLLHSPGGSSGGSAAALAAGITPLELGSDLAGSIRLPAHCCGVYGHKPSYGLVPQRGHGDGPTGKLSEMDLVVVGPMARTAQDLDLALQIIAGPVAVADHSFSAPLAAPRSTQLANFRVRLWLDDAYTPQDHTLKAAYQALAQRLRDAGCTVSEGPPTGVSLAETFALFFKLMAAAVAGNLAKKVYKQAQQGALIGRLTGKNRPGDLLGLATAVTMSHREWLLVHEQREKLKAKMQRFFTQHDVLLTPVMGHTAIAHQQKGGVYDRKLKVNQRSEKYGNQMHWAALASTAGLPATVAPVGVLANGLPFGVQIVGPFLEDRTTIAFAHALTELGYGYTPPPRS